MKHDTLIFDLDGTISDSKEGIVKSVNYALQHFGFESKSETEIAQYIGPQLDVAFKRLTKSEDKTLISALVTKHRERYTDIGYAENTLYDGIREALTALHQHSGSRLGVCTSKRTDFAKKILDMFGLIDLFDFVDGGDIGIEKRQQLQGLLQQGKISNQSVMIGDRYVDLTAAHANSLSSAGVLWGYGSRKEIVAEDPSYIFSSTGQLLELIA